MYFFENVDRQRWWKNERPLLYLYLTWAFSSDELKFNIIQYNLSYAATQKDQNGF